MGGGAAAGGDFDALLAQNQNGGWRGLFHNGRALGLACFASIGGILYGYNQGVFGQVQVMYSFEQRYTATLSNTDTKGLLTSILELGAFLGALMAGPLADRFSRKYSISAWCIVFMMGTAIQTGANSNVACIYAGRWFAGMGVGALSMLVPMFNAELAPPGIRGSLVALQQLAITSGIMISYWIGYGTNYIGGTGEGQTTAAWRVPLGLQLVPAVVLCISLIILIGREEECLTNLAMLRKSTEDSPEVQYEFRALQAERLVEREAAKERYGQEDVNFRVTMAEYKRLFTTKPLLHRLFLGAGCQTLQQWTGINAIIYYAPTIFAQIGLSGAGAGGTISLLATGIVGIVQFVFTIPAVLFVDNFGRKPILAWGEANMAISHAIIAALVAVYGDRFTTHKSAANAAVFFIYWYIANFACTWGPLAWVVSAEVFPLDMRAKGMSVSSGANWIMNFTVAMVTPHMIESIGYKTYIVFMCFCVVGFLYSIFILPELKGLSLEEVDQLFHDTSGAEDRARRDRIAAQIGLDKVANQIQHREKANDAEV
ncbi:galactose transporter [Cryptococcus deuterogattii 99/473]|uniref:Galactose transporter n=1 Tax=Cryptococcus deuterogattii Ram5 TaxID=1296110 RepID=A0A0D0V8M9_9TREE|nr:galactose transporter [Cryptococcus deuterogattii LA55]KIR31330.1 galactose transporter [Cryptococcus deuterogattii MMRL2647]KIR41205.1 galactose transporter [Cryptococcus deuterogattii Ram5]KIR72560.1 galactose transporter [Cryptococcus deuterogattii CA1014]KIR92156.1 galactose transporter [Cryptococcus deuterogattii CBS 10090]KIR96136.1 galactose transporter [Cryptococcus deuterogattii 2001/935-1]KIY55474.1 galactose transporter [Cryptococcus deuterogattii 99/473]